MPLRNGYSPSTVIPNGPQPSLDLYSVMASANTTVRVELLDSSGKTIWQGSITVTSTPSLLKALVSAQSGGDSAWLLADGALVMVTGANTVYLNTGGDPVAMPPSTSSILSWVPTEVNAIGYIAG